jgi:N6-adenosine-specific RNA methylase IME4
VEKIPEGKKGTSSEKAGKMFNVNERYVRDIKKLKAEGRQEKIEEIRSGKTTLQDVKKEDRIKKIAKQKEELEKEVLETPIGDYDVIVIDPPWHYQDDKIYDAKGFRGTCDYPTMSIEQIKNITLPAKDDCVLWLWTTNKHIFDCREILNEWGFEIKSILTWDKVNIGMGRWLRSQTEHCILAVKGKPYFNNKSQSTIFQEKRTTHSTKPEKFYEIVEKICAGRKLDYFARKKREGWDVWGNEINKFT